ARTFTAALHARSRRPLRHLLRPRRPRAPEMTGGPLPRFKPEPARIRADRSWTVAGSAGAPGLEDRRVELTGPVTEPEVVAALNSQAKVWLADLEDATSPTWANVIGGQLNLYRAIRGQ